MGCGLFFFWRSSPAGVHDAREFIPARVVARGERVDPVARRGAQLLEPNSAVGFGEPVEFFEAGPEQRLRPSTIAPGVVVERGGHLDNALKKSSLRLGRSQPDLFPGLMGIEKMALVELLETSAKFFFCLSWLHRLHLDSVGLSPGRNPA